MRIFTKEHKEKLRLAKLGKPSGAKGKHWTMKEDKRKNMSRGKGSSSPFWKGGYERTLWRNRQRRVQKLENGGSHTLQEWETLKAQYNWTCPCCKKCIPTIVLTADHIIPLYKGGSDNIENVQPLCKSCNSKKFTKIHKYET